jgi:hypothetical protein
LRPRVVLHRHTGTPQKIKKSKDPSNTINDKIEWKRVSHLLRATYSDLLVLSLADNNSPGMDKLYYLVQRTMESIKESVSELNNPELLPLPMSGNVNYMKIELEDTEEGGTTTRQSIRTMPMMPSPIQFTGHWVIRLSSFGTAIVRTWTLTLPLQDGFSVCKRR